jgi:hypothetical protein
MDMAVFEGTGIGHVWLTSERGAVNSWFPLITPPHHVKMSHIIEFCPPAQLFARVALAKEALFSSTVFLPGNGEYQ